MNNDELVQDIGALLMNDPDISEHPWEHLAIVAQMKGRSMQVNGFAYQSDAKAVPTAPGNFDIFDKFEALNKAMQEPVIESR